MADMSGEVPIETPKKLQVFKELKARGLPYTAIAGLMGNIDVETGGTFDFQEKQGKDDKGPGYGLFQFEGGHKKAYYNYLKNNKLEDSEASQIDYVLNNINKGEGYDIGGKNRKRLRKSFASGSPEDVTLKFSDIFENPSIPHNDRRVESALTIYDSLMQRKKGGRVERNPYNYEPRPI